MKKNSLSRIVVFTWFLTLVLGLDLKAQNDAEAGKWLDEASETMSRYENISVDFDYVLDNRAEDVTQELSGSVLLQGEMYVVNLFGSTQIYDGNNTYTIIPENEEVNISDADVNDESTFTPSKFYSFYKSGYTYVMGEQKALNGKKVQFITLTPIDSNSEVASILVGIEVGSKHIYQVIEIGNNETRTILTAKKIETNQKMESKTFSFDEQKYIDMNYLINR